MLIRCTHCHTPFTLTNETMHAALHQLEERGWKHYNAYCPRCGRPNVVPRDQLMRAAPSWSPDGTVQPAPRPGVVTTPAAQPAAPKPAPKPAQAAPRPAAKKVAAKKATAKTAAAKPAKKATAKKPAAKKAAKPAKKSTTKKPAKKATKKKKK